MRFQLTHRNQGRAALLLACLNTAPLWADDAAPEPKMKLSVGEYFYDDHGDRYQGQDINLRYRSDDTSLWLGYYHDPLFGKEGRAGFDTDIALYEPAALQLLPSLLVATRGFAGGSLAVQAGAPLFGQVGIARTNLKPYTDLNFDPGDAISFAVGYHADGGQSFTLSTVHDDRLHTGQRNSHAIVQWPLPGSHRVTFDLSHKSGEGDEGHVSAWGASMAYDFPRWFVRAAYDADQNFGPADVARITAGTRFW